MGLMKQCSNSLYHNELEKCGVKPTNYVCPLQLFHFTLHNWERGWPSGYSPFHLELTKPVSVKVQII